MKKRLYIVTLEPLEQRYTKQWFEYWREEFSKYFDVRYINGKYEGDTIEKGRFLDINKTNLYKAQQVELIATLFGREDIKDGHIFLFMDGWHFGITATKYMAQLNNIKIKMFTYLHAGTWDDNDFITQAGMRSWADCNEAGWLCACDGHFVSTQYHKKLIVDYFEHEEFEHKIHVVGFPMMWYSEIWKELDKKNLIKKENAVVFPHRLDPEKQPKLFDCLKDELSNYEFIKTFEHSKNKKEYYQLLAKAKVSFSASLQETFGIGMVEAVMLGCVPLVPDRLSYRELYPEEFRYKDMDDAIDKLRLFMANFKLVSLQNKLLKIQMKIVLASSTSIKRMTQVMKRDE